MFSALLYDLSWLFIKKKGENFFSNKQYSTSHIYSPTQIYPHTHIQDVPKNNADFCAPAPPKNREKNQTPPQKYLEKILNFAKESGNIRNLQKAAPSPRFFGGCGGGAIAKPP